MNVPQPSINFLGSDPGSHSGSRFNNNWIYQKTCYLCYTSLGCGQHRQRKLYCRMCRRAVCPACSHEPLPAEGKESMCKVCEKGQSTPQKSDWSDVRGNWLKPAWTKVNQMEDVRRYSEASYELGRSDLAEDKANATVEDALQSARFVLEDLKSKQCSTSPSQMTQKSSALLARLQSQLTDYDTELVDVRRQVGYYAEELDHRETSIEDMSMKMQRLTRSNSELEQRVANLELALGQLSEKCSEISSSQENKSETCVHCLIF